MNFIDYCIATRNYSAINAVREFAEVTVKNPGAKVATALGASYLLYKLGKRSGRKENEDLSEANLRIFAEWAKKHGISTDPSNLTTHQLNAITHNSGDKLDEDTLNDLFGIEPVVDDDGE